MLSITGGIGGADSVKRPGDMGMPDKLSVQSLKDALMSFPQGTGLGHDSLHPRAVTRLPDRMLEALVEIMWWCEMRGQWPADLITIIALLAKPDGGYMPRVWMRARRAICEDWERAHPRDYRYAGTSRGADIAAWKQALRAEAAHAYKLEYIQILLDLVTNANAAEVIDNMYYSGPPR